MTQANNKEVLITVQNLKKYFPIYQGTIIKRHVGDVKATDDVSFSIYKGETLGVVGESGCGKSTTGKTILQLHKPTAGEVLYKGEDLTKAPSEHLRSIRRQLRMIFQDPYASLNPRKPIGASIAEPLEIHGIGTPASRWQRVLEMMDKVGLDPNFAKRYPHEFSGGQRQRVGIARALVTNPEFIVADEPIAALDVSIQAQVVNLMDKLKKEMGLTYLFIAHDLSMIRYISDRVAVMYLGVVAELGHTDVLFNHPLHPYTQALISAIPIPNPIKEKERKRIVLPGDIPSPANPPTGCRFHPRCQSASDLCKHEVPKLRDFGKPDKRHFVACHHAEQFVEANNAADYVLK